MTKKQKAEFAITCPEIRDWVFNHLKSRVSSYNYWRPINLWKIAPPTSFANVTKSNTMQLNDWLSNPKHLYNNDGAIALMNAFLEFGK